MYKFYLDGVLLPVTPGTLTMKVENKDETIDIMNGGTYTILNPPGLTQYEFEFFLPATNLPFAQYEGGFRNPQYYINHIESLKTSGKAFTFIVTRNITRDKSNLNAYEDTNLKVSMAECTITESAEEYGLGKSVKLTLKQYKSYSTQRVSISGTSGGTTITVDDSIPRYAIVKEGTYISKEGETLKDIAFKFLGDEKYAEALALVQNPALEFTLEPLPEFTILQIDEDAIKAKYDEITVDPTDVDIWEPTTYIDGIKNGTITSAEYEQFKTLIEPIVEPKMVNTKRKVSTRGMTMYITTKTKVEAPFNEQPALIQFSYLIDGLLDAYAKAQKDDRQNELDQIDKDIESLDTEIYDIDKSKTTISTQMILLEDSDMDATLKSNILETYEKILTELDDNRKKLATERKSLSRKRVELTKLPLGTVELTISDSDLESIRSVLDTVKSEVVASTTVTTWVQEIGILEAK